jgi:hypothetical protein
LYEAQSLPQPLLRDGSPHRVNVAYQLQDVDTFVVLCVTQVVAGAIPHAPASACVSTVKVVKAYCGLYQAL